MRVILHIDSGPATGRKVLLRSGQRLSVGRSFLNDIAVEHDDQMSAKHFEIVTNSHSCCLVDLDSSNGTQANGVTVDRIALRNDDQVSAGTTRFHIDIDGADDSPDEQPDQAIASASPVAKPNRVQFPVDPWKDVSIERLSTNLACCHGPTPITMIAELLAAELPLYLSVDFRKLRQEIPAELTTVAFLFDWLSDEVAKANSPVLFPATAAVNWQQIVADAAGKDAIVLFFASLAFDDLVKHIQSQLRSGTPDAQQVLGICWPSVIGIQLTFGQPMVTEQIMAGIEYVLIEQPEDSTWKLIGHDVPSQVQHHQCQEKTS